MCILNPISSADLPLASQGDWQVWAVPSNLLTLGRTPTPYWYRFHLTEGGYWTLAPKYTCQSFYSWLLLVESPLWDNRKDTIKG